jgi:hypothetical protein
MGEAPSVGITAGSDSDDLGIKNLGDHKENIKKGFIFKKMGHNSAKTLFIVPIVILATPKFGSIPED